MRNLKRSHLYLIGAWLVINLIQSAYTGLHFDESYYWMYSENMSWGYFDHPPMVALLIHLGRLIFPGEIGVRLILVLLSTLTLALILNELNEQKDLLFLAVFVLSFPLIHTHIASFLALPDTPLLFFTVLFLFLYRKFSQQPTAKLSFLLALVLSSMIYSKYHAFLVIGFTVLSNLKLLRNKYFWGTVVLTVFFLTPHIWWQIENEFPTFKYHLVDRVKPFRMKYVFPNLINQLVVAGPLTGVLILWKLTKFKINTNFDRALIFNILGFYILFFLLSFKNRIEAHWSAPVIPMLMLATYPMILADPLIKKWFKRLAIPVIALFFLFRIYLALDIIPNVGHTKLAFYKGKEHALEIKKMAGSKKVGFFNNYATISNYIFYTGDSAILLSTPTYRFCQYDLWNEEKFANGEPLFAIQPKQLNPPNLTRMKNGQMKGFIEIEEFQSLKGLKITLLKAEANENEIALKLVLNNTTGNAIFTDHISKPSLGIRQGETEIFSMPLIHSSKKKIINPGEKATMQFTISTEKTDPRFPLIFYTRSRENIRGEIVSFQAETIFGKLSGM